MFNVHLTFGNFKNFKIYKTQLGSSKCWCTCVSVKALLRGWEEGILAETHTAISRATGYKEDKHFGAV